MNHQLIIRSVDGLKMEFNDEAKTKTDVGRCSVYCSIGRMFGVRQD
jgi:hypothetical protein